MRYLRKVRRYGGLVGAVAIAALVTGCSSTIHEQANVGGVDTLSIDAKQRLMLVGTRPPTRRGDYPIPVTCTEPSPDALVARAAAIAANANITAPTGEYGGSGGLAASSSEAAGSIGFRNQTVQMLRDGYFRLCEAYLNGALTKEEYQIMISNADTFMAVVAALEVLGSQPVAPAVAIAPGALGASTKDGAAITGPAGTENKTIVFQNVTGTKPDAANAKVVGDIVRSYLGYRERLNSRLIAIRSARPK